MGGTGCQVCLHEICKGVKLQRDSFCVFSVLFSKLDLFYSHMRKLKKDPINIFTPHKLLWPVSCVTGLPWDPSGKGHRGQTASGDSAWRPKTTSTKPQKIHLVSKALRLKAGRKKKKRCIHNLQTAWKSVDCVQTPLDGGGCYYFTNTGLHIFAVSSLRILCN